MPTNVPSERVRNIFLQPYLPAYLSGWVATTAWLAAVTMSIGELGFTVVAHGLNTLGFVVSLGLRYAVDRTEGEHLWRRVINPSIFVRLLFFLFVVVPGFAMLPGFHVIFPAGAYDMEELMIGALFIWGHVLYSFSMVSESLVLFSSIPGIAMFGLMSTVNVNASLNVAFLVFTLGNIFQVGYMTLLHHTGGRLPVRREVSGLAPTQRLLRLMMDQFIVSAMLLGITTVGGVGVAVTLQKVSPQVLPIALARIQLPDWYYQTTENYTGFLHSFRVGTGPVLLSNEPVMRVQCERGLLWRGAVYNKYTGRAWEQTNPRNGWAPLAGPPGYFAIEANIASLEGLAPRPRVVQRILAEKQMPSVLFGAAEPVLVEGRMMHVVQTSYGGISAPRMVFKGSQYVVQSDIPDDFTPAQLRSAGTVYPPEIESLYRSELPFGTERIRELTQKVIADAATPYDRARAIQEYLEQNYVYGDVERVPAGEDVASYFLFRSRQGVCDMFATAMVLMSREAGIPARLVTGFAAGQFNPERQEYLVTHKEAHAWAELYFPGYGWIPFDPQAQRTAGLMTTLTSWFESGGSVFRLFSERNLFPLTLAGLTLALIYYALRPAWRRRPKPLTPQDHRGHVVHLYHRMGALLRRRGYPRQPGQTPREYLTHLARTAPLEPALRRSLEDLTAIFHAARYSRAPITAADHQQARALVMALRRQVRSWRR